MRHHTNILAIALAIAITAGCAPNETNSHEAAVDEAAAAGDVDTIVREAVTKAGAPNAATDVRPSPIPGFLEAVVDGRVVYVSADGKFLIQGVLIDVATRANLTAVAESSLHLAELAKVPADQRIIFAAAEPKHVVTIFTDPDCGYCRKLHSEIAEYNALGISVEYLLYPRSGIASPTYGTSVSVWCAADRKGAFNKALAGEPVPAATCDNPVAGLYQLGGRVGVQGTPTMYTEKGLQIPTYLPPAALLAQLDGAAVPQTIAATP